MTIHRTIKNRSQKTLAIPRVGHVKKVLVIKIGGSRNKMNWVRYKLWNIMHIFIFITYITFLGMNHDNLISTCRTTPQSSATAGKKIDFNHFLICKKHFY